MSERGERWWGRYLEQLDEFLLEILDRVVILSDEVP